MLRRFSRLHLRRRRSNPRRFMASPPLPSPFAFSGGDGTAVLAPQPDPQAGTPQGEDGDPAPPAAWEDVEFGFQRPEFGTNPLVGTVQPYDRHLFLCYKSPEVWPRNVEGSDSDRLPRLLAAEIKASNSSFDKKAKKHFRSKRKVRCYICQEEGHIKDDYPKLKKKEKDKGNIPIKSKHKILKATWDETSSPKSEIEAYAKLGLMADH